MRYEAIDYVKCVAAEDLWADDTGGDVSVTGGGVGQKFIQLQFRTQWYRGMKFRVRIWEPKANH